MLWWCLLGRNEGVEAEERNLCAGEQLSSLLVLLGLQRLVELLEQVREFSLGHCLCIRRDDTWELGSGSGLACRWRGRDYSVRVMGC